MKIYSRKIIAASLVLLVTASFGCSHKEVASPEAKLLSYSKSILHLNLAYSFGFSFEGHDYNFVSASTEGYLYDCQRYDGYKDDKLTYSFTGQQTREVTAIYQTDIKIEEKLRRAVRLIDSFSPRMYTCQSKPAAPTTLGYKAGKALEVGANYLVYGTMAVLVSPIVVPAMLSDNHSESEMLAALQKIRLGDSYEKINKTLKYKSIEETSSDYLIQSFSSPRSMNNSIRLLFVYKEQKLIAYVWGIQPQ